MVVLFNFTLYDVCSSDIVLNKPLKTSFNGTLPTLADTGRPDSQDTDCLACGHCCGQSCSSAGNNKMTVCM
jgi:hypothetical protein